MITQDDIDDMMEEEELMRKNTINPENTATIAAAVKELRRVEDQVQGVRNLKVALEREEKEKQEREAQIQRDLTELTHLREVVGEQNDEIAELSERLRLATGSNQELAQTLNDGGLRSYNQGWQDRDALDLLCGQGSSNGIHTQDFLMGALAGVIVCTMIASIVALFL
jgi:predicted RNase H-like nuclease (RuvC/YqgF family)